MTKSEDWEQFSAYRPMIEDARRRERERAISIMEAADLPCQCNKYRNGRTYWLCQLHEAINKISKG